MTRATTSNDPLRIAVLGLRGPACEGGIERHVDELVPLLARRNAKITVLGRSPYRNERAPKQDGVSVEWLWAPRTSWLETLVHSFIGLAWALRNRPDVLHVHAIGPALITPFARLFGLRVVVTHHGFDYDRERWGSIAKLILKLGERFGMRFANERIVISREILQHVSSQFHVTSNLIPNGVRMPPETAGTQTLCSLGLTPKRYVIQVSRSVPEKRQLDLVEAFAKAAPKGWKLALVGTLKPGDAYCEKLKARAAELPNVVLTGYRTGDELNQLYANAGLFVLPSSHEGLPIALLEGLSHGLPVVVSDIPSNLEVGLAQECYYRLGDTDELADRISANASARQTPEEILERRRFVSDRYDWNAIATQTMQVMQRAAGR